MYLRPSLLWPVDLGIKNLVKYPTLRKNTTTGEAGGCAYAGIARGFLYTKS